MPPSVVMPALELAQESGKVLHWLKSPGDTVRKGEPLVEIETDKVTTEIEAPASGALRDGTAREGEGGPVGPESPGVGTVWRIMAGRMPTPSTTAPHFYLPREVNVSRLISWRERATK